jgi:hypothetical protein|tara:strand:- start:4863 stop:5210 length:348 start_codon:yes stop_codon:yes gene_type:complete
MANTSLSKVFDGVTADGNSTEVAWPGGVGQMVVEGTWGGGTVALQMSPDDSVTWVAIGGDATITADGVVSFNLNGCDIRLNLSGSTGANINGWLTETVRDGIWGKGIMHCPLNNG